MCINIHKYMCIYIHGLTYMCDYIYIYMQCVCIYTHSLHIGMVDFTCQLVWVDWVPRHLVKRDSGCAHEGISG